MQDVWPKSWKVSPKFFKPSECGFTRGNIDKRISEGRNMDFQFMMKIDGLRSQFHKPMIIGSGYRTAEHNRKIGGAANSAHVKGRAVDVNTVGWQSWERKELVRIAKLKGIQGVGIADTFIHLDDYTKKDGATRPLTWLYERVGGKLHPKYLTGHDVPESAW